VEYIPLFITENNQVLHLLQNQQQRRRKQQKRERLAFGCWRLAPNKGLLAAVAAALTLAVGQILLLMLLMQLREPAFCNNYNIKQVMDNRPSHTSF
jgi:DNA-binding response OmpR family regulator